MCFQALLAIPGLAAGAQVLGVGLSVVGALSSASAQSAAAEASAQQKRNNAVIAQRNAEDARQRGVVEQQDIQMRNKARIGQQILQLSEKNIDVASGSPLDILGDTAMFGKLDELTTRDNFEREAIAAETQAYNFRAQADLDTLSAKSATTSGILNAFSAGIGGFNDYAKRNTVKL